MLRSLGLRARLVLLILAALVPVLVWLVVSAGHERQAALERARLDLRAQAMLAAAHQERLVDNTRHLLESIAGGVAAREGRAAQCNTQLAALLRQYTLYADLAVLSLQGQPVCRAPDSAQPVPGPSPAFVAAVLAHHGFLADEARAGPSATSTAPVLHFGVPVYGVDGQVRGVVVAAVDLAVFARTLAAQPVPEGLVLSVLARGGALLGHHPRDAGALARAAALHQASSAPAGEALEAPANDGRVWLHMLAAVGSGSGLQVLASMPRDAVLAPPTQAFTWRLLALLASALLGGACAWWVGWRAIVAPARAMLRVAHRVGAGQLSARVEPGVLAQRGELARLGRALNRMAASIEARQLALDEALRATEKEHAMLELIVNSMGEGVVAADLQGKLLLYNAAVARHFPAALAGEHVTDWRSWVELRDATGQTLLPDAARPLSRAMRGENVDNYEVLMRAEDTDDRILSCNVRPLLDAQEQLVGGLVVFTDVTARKAAGQLHADQEQVLELIAGGVTLAEALAAVARMVEAHAHGSLCSVLLREGPLLRFAVAPSLPGSFGTLVDRLEIGEHGGACGMAAHTRRMVAVVDIAADALMADWREVAREYDLSACWSSPVLSATGEVLGTFALYYRTLHRPAEHELALVANATRLVRIAIERDRALQALQHSESRFRELADTVQDVFYVREVATGELLYVSPAYEQLWGRSRESLHADPWSFVEAIVPEDRPLAEADFERQRRGEATDVEYRIQRPGGELRWVRNQAWPVLGPSGQAERVVGTARDLTERKQAELRLAWTNRSLQLLSRCNEALIRMEDEPQLLLEICRLAVRIGGYRLAWVGYAQDDAARTIRPMAHAGEEQGYLDEVSLTWRDDDPRGQGPAGRAVRSGQATVSSDITREDSAFFWQEAALRRGLRSLVCLPLREAGRTFGLLALYGAQAHDVADSEVRLLQDLADNLAFGIGAIRTRQARLAVEAQVREQASLLDKAQDAILVRDLDHHVRYWNQGAQRLYGWTAAEAIGQPAHQLLYRDATAFHAAVRELLARGDWVGELEQVARDGTPLTIEARWTLVRDEHGAPASVLCINTDIRERRRAQQEILALNAGLELRVRERTEQLEIANRELEAFSYSVAHDLRAPLVTVDGFSHALERALAPAADSREAHYLARVRNGVRQMGEMIDALLSLAQLSRTQLRWDQVDLSALARAALEACREREPRHQVLTEVQDGLRVRGDARLLKLVLENLVGNAWKFSAGVAAPRISVGQEIGPAGEKVIFVRDNGAGFDMAYADKLFGVFQRLHPGHQFAGTGLGLANVQRIVLRHGGRVWGESAPGEGATFRFTLGEPPPSH